MDQNVTIPLGMIFGTSYELNKRLTAATKIHRIPTRQTNVVEYMTDEEDEEVEVEGEVEVRAMDTEVSSISKEIANLDVEVSDDVDQAKYTSAQGDPVSKTERTDGFAICVNVDAEIASADRVTPKVLGLGSDKRLTRTFERGSRVRPRVREPQLKELRPPGLRRSSCGMSTKLTIDSEIREDVAIPSVDSGCDDERMSIANLDRQESQVSDESFERMSRDDKIDCVRERRDTESLASGHGVRLGESAIVPAPESPVDSMTDLDEVHGSQIRAHEPSYEISFKFDDDESSTMSSGHDGTSERVSFDTTEYEISDESLSDAMAADVPGSRESAMPESLKVERAVHVQTETVERETESRELRPPSLHSSIVEKHVECADSSQSGDSGYSEQDAEFRELRPLSPCSTVVEESLSFSPSDYSYQTADDDEVRDEIRARVSQSKDPPAMRGDLWKMYGPCGYFMPWHTFPVVVDPAQRSSEQLLGCDLEIEAPTESKLSAAQPPIQKGGNVIEFVEAQPTRSVATVLDENESTRTSSFSFERNMAQNSYPNDAGREDAAKALESDRKFATQRRLEHQRGSRGSGGLFVENHAAEVTKLRRELEVERRRNSTPPLVQGTITLSEKSNERTLEVNASTRTDKRRQVNEDRTTRKNDVRDDNSTVTLARVHQSTDPPAERGDSRITDGVIHEVFEYDGNSRRVAREHEFKELRPPGLELSRVLCDGISETWTSDSKERVAGVAQPKDPPSRRSSLYMESESSDGSEFGFEELRPPDPDLTLDEKGGVRQASSSFDLWMDLARGQFHRERSATRETEMRKGKIVERDEVRPSVAGTSGSVRGKLYFKDDPMMSSESSESGVDRLTSGGRKSKKTRT
ncbi:uncharacterized protein EI90DRAFT_3075387 [Cantharellus anzutake]|uniref:uncharacterized protein n=1 Tax=Cantharellus anzutake TaxID=1750568 RepID=UPI001904EFCC|nr:uncharacterized protein EI90DRAFT_3075387 [Cantharellus anzutake]KAF8324441.1 hypothetical protein EI90DRAFT_3075387 [Cantharellus anzutake]